MAKRGHLRRSYRVRSSYRSVAHSFCRRESYFVLHENAYRRYSGQQIRIQEYRKPDNRFRSPSSDLSWTVSFFQDALLEHRRRRSVHRRRDNLGSYSHSYGRRAQPRTDDNPYGSRRRPRGGYIRIVHGCAQSEIRHQRNAYDADAELYSVVPSEIFSDKTRHGFLPEPQFRTPDIQPYTRKLVDDKYRHRKVLTEYLAHNRAFIHGIYLYLSE